MSHPSIDPRKTASVAEFLKTAFPGHHVYDREDSATDCQFYRIDEGGAGNVKYRVRVSREFLDDNPEDRILQRLKEWGLPDMLRRAGVRTVLVTNTGCSIVGADG